MYIFYSNIELDDLAGMLGQTITKRGGAHLKVDLLLRSTEASLPTASGKFRMSDSMRKIWGMVV